jgi:S-adenosylmethionine:tRNA ribosyltransferase-isomerase
MHPRNISILDYTYHLPEDKIASYPLADRDASKLLSYRDGNISEYRFHQLADHLPGNTLLFFNNTRVMEARIVFQKPSGGSIEVFCLDPHESLGDMSNAIHQKNSVHWKCLIGGASKWKKSMVLEKKSDSVSGPFCLKAKLVEKRSDHFIIEFSWTPAQVDFVEVLHLTGAIPLPPYIKRKPSVDDSKRYQTIYADRQGSVAAPTAGLHFTESLFSQLTSKNIRMEFITLHVGAGTFKPVKAAFMEGHEMHPEFIDVSRTSVEKLLQSIDKNIVAVGTTSLRTLESLYWMGVKIVADPNMKWGPVAVDQWDPYEPYERKITAKESIEALLNWMHAQGMDRIFTKTKLLIAPGYRFRLIDGLITNFHQPQSTLLLLVAALLGDDWKKVYRYALDNEFRFLSYGDGCLLFGGRNNNLP